MLHFRNMSYFFNNYNLSSLLHISSILPFSHIQNKNNTNHLNVYNLSTRKLIHLFRLKKYNISCEIHNQKNSRPIMNAK